MQLGESCIFCAVDPARVVAANDLAFAIRDGFPVSEGHTLVIPRRHTPDWWGATPAERTAIDALLRSCREHVDGELAPDGYNVGINNGAAAGQTVFHLHVHLIPRYDGDVPDPRGGIRHAVPGRGNWQAAQSPVERAASALHAGPGRPLGAALGDTIALEGIRRADLLVSFVLVSGLFVIEPELERVLDAGGSVRLLTSDYLGVTEKDALVRLHARATEYGDRFQVRVFRTDGRSFHPKSYLFGVGEDGYTVGFTGSANISRPGLVDGVEWSVETRDDAALEAMEASFEGLWAAPQSEVLTQTLIEGYEQAPRPEHGDAVAVSPPVQPFAPSEVQEEALRALETTRAEGFAAGMVAMATGLGKTWLAVFDSARPQFRRVLFVAHREEILHQTREVFRRVRPQASVGYFMGPRRELDADIVLATVQTLANTVAGIDAKRFDYVVVDEFHHAAALTYRRVVNHLEPKFLLGLTATPDRADGADLLSLCEDNLVYECGLAPGISRGLLSPFRYHGVPDPVDFAPLPWRNARFEPQALESAVTTAERADAALREWERLRGARTLAFCVSQRHADFMARRFRAAGYRAVAVHAGPSSHPRRDSLAQLEAGTLDVVFSVDMFNEGVDVPAVDTVLMLRPTQSPVLFLQQIGRGLRRSEGKDFVRIIDFVGNHKSFLLPARVLAGLSEGRLAGDAGLRTALADGFTLPDGCSVDYELQARDELVALLPKAARGQALRAFVREWAAERGERPKAAQAYAAGYNPAAAPGHWLAFCAAVGVLTADEERIVGRCEDLLRDVSKTSMTKSYKMVALRAFARADRLEAGVGVAELAADSRRLVLRDPALVRDVVSKEIADPARVSEERWQAWWLRWPLQHLADKGGFRLRGDRFEVATAVAPEDAELLARLIGELVDWRVAQYLDRRRPGDGQQHRLKVIRNASGQPILMLDRAKNPGLPEGRGIPVVADGRRYTFDFMKIAVNVARADGKDGNVLGDLLKGWFGEAAGEAGTEFRVLLRTNDDGWTAAPERRDAGESDHKRA